MGSPGKAVLRHLYIPARPGHPTFPAFLKLKRAHEQKRALKAEIASFIETHKPDAITRCVDPQTGEIVLKYIAPELPLMWSVQIGEILHNLRSSLDNIVYKLVELEGEKAPRIGMVGFPICSDSKEFEDKGRKMIAGLTDKSAALVRSLQPYHRGQADRHVLTMLNDLAKIDRHRMVHLCVVEAKVKRLEVQPLKSKPGRVYSAPAGVLKNGAEVLRLPPATTRADLKIDTRISFSVSIQEETVSGDLRDAGVILDFVGWQAFDTACELYKRFTPSPAGS